MTDARERLKDEAVRDAIRRIASGEQPLTKGQLEAMATWPSKWAAEERLAAKGPDRSMLLMRAVKQASGLIREVLRAHGVPAGVQDSLRQALAVLEGESPDAMEPEDQVAELAKKMAAALVKKAVDSIHDDRRGGTVRRLMGQIAKAARGKEEDNSERRGLQKLTREARNGKLP